MILGQVNAFREVVIPVTVRDQSAQPSTVQAIIDTGFTEALTLPSAAIQALALPFSNTMTMVLADGSLVSMDMYDATVLWDGQDRKVLVHEAEGEPLAGVALLYGHRLSIDLVDGGDVRIQALPVTG